MSPQPSTYIHLVPETAEGMKHADRTYLLYFIPGNPGLIEYYRTFLTHLFGLLTSPTSTFATSTLSSSSPSVDFEIHGRSLYGFECGHTPPVTHSEYGTTVAVPHAPPYTVKEQLALSQKEIRNVVRDAQQRGKKDLRVILMGHSFGTYMALEIMRRLREEGEVRVVGGVLLFATIVDIAKSPKGVKMAPLLSTPYLPTLSSLVPSLFIPLPLFALTSIISTLLSFPHDAAHTAACFLKSRHGLQQCVYMAHDEMKEITVDRWDEEVWGAAHESRCEKGWGRPVLRILFGEGDSWVADETRDQLIRARGRSPPSTPTSTSTSNTKSSPSSTLSPSSSEEAEAEAEVEVEHWKPIMEIDPSKTWPHDFCIRHSIPVAEKAFGYVSDIVAADLKA